MPPRGRKIEDESEVKEAFNTICEVLKSKKVHINEFDYYDGFIVKELSKTNSADRENNQYHTAITSVQMELFPYLKSDIYFNSSTREDSLKNYFYTEIPILLNLSNKTYLETGEVVESNQTIKTNAPIARSKRQDGTKQFEIGHLPNLVGKDYEDFSKSLHKGYYLIMLKIKGKFKYEAYGIRKEDGDDLKDLNGNFYMVQNRTFVSLNKFFPNSQQEKLDYCENTLLYFKDVLENYEYIKGLVETEDGYNYTQQWKKVLTSIIPFCLEKIVDDSKYSFKGSYGQPTNWASCPWVGIFDKDISSSPQEGYYLAYIFKKNLKGFYLSLCFSVGSNPNKERREYLESISKEFRKLLNKKLKIDYLDTSMELESDGIYPKAYMSANICSKYYDVDNFPTNEQFFEDLMEFLEIYDLSKKFYNEEELEFLNDEENENQSERDIKYESITFNQFLSYKGFYFDKKSIENYLLSLKVKPFVILTGNSGTGKTKLSQLFAEYSSLYYTNSKIIPVGANWTDNRNIFGYYNVISKKFQSTPALTLINKAANETNKDKPHFLILDEMNLSHVERYFSDFLSSIESQKPIPLHNSEGNGIKYVEDENSELIEANLNIPNNLFVVGTVNVDETTYMFSPKVLDRANVLEFETFSENSISISDFMNKKTWGDEFEGADEANLSYLENPLSDLGILEKPINYFQKSFKLVKIKEGHLLKKIPDDKNKDNSWVVLSNELTGLHNILKKSGFDFGFRVVNEIIAFMYVAGKYNKFFESNDPIEEKDWNRYFDAQIKQKILPKIHGSKKVLDDTLDELLAFCLKDKFENKDLPKAEEITKDNAIYYTSAKKIAEMREVLEKQRYVSFIN